MALRPVCTINAAVNLDNTTSCWQITLACGDAAQTIQRIGRIYMFWLVLLANKIRPAPGLGTNIRSENCQTIHVHRTSSLSLRIAPIQQPISPTHDHCCCHACPCEQLGANSKTDPPVIVAKGNRRRSWTAEIEQQKCTVLRCSDAKIQLLVHKIGKIKFCSAFGAAEKPFRARACALAMSINSRMPISG